MTATRERLAVLRLAAAVIVLTLLGADPQAAVPKRVLIVHSFGRDFAPYNPTGQAFRTRLTELLKQPVVFHDVSLDVERGEIEDEQPLVDTSCAARATPVPIWSSPSPTRRHSSACGTGNNCSPTARCS